MQPESSHEHSKLLADLMERAKELNCLYVIEEILRDESWSVEEMLRRVIEALPSGWQYSSICQAQITLKDQVFQSPQFEASPWQLKAQIRIDGDIAGNITVQYTEPMPELDEGPFLKDERRLIDTIADRLSNSIMHRHLTEAMKEWRQVRERFFADRSNEWGAILELLRSTDQGLLARIARKMINHLCWNGVKEADELLKRYGLVGLADRQEQFGERNQPLSRSALPEIESFLEDVFITAAKHLSDEEIVESIHKWIKQDKASFLVNTVENHHTSLAEVSDAIRRYQHASRDEIELEVSTRKGLHVSLIRRFLSDQLEYINVAKNYISIKDFHGLLQKVIFPVPGHGKVGGKGSGLLLATQIIRHFADRDAALADVRVPNTWYLTSDGLQNFIYCNHLEDVFTQKYKEIDEVRQEYPDIIQVFKNSMFSSDIIKGLSLALDDLGDSPLIVRSSSLLEDRFGAAFSGKYKSLFVANQGSKKERLGALTDAIAEVYASTFGPDPIQYRAERNLLDFQEGMGVLIQQVVGTRMGRYYLPSYAGVAFSRNEFRWSPRIKPEDGLIRLVVGLGTRAVDRLGDDYPILACPGSPGLRANTTVDEIIRYAPRYADVINLDTGSFETKDLQELLREVGDAWPGLQQLISVHSDGLLRQPIMGQVDFESDDLVVTGESLLTRTSFIEQIKSLITVLEEELNTPVDIEFAHDGQHLYLLQCRAQNQAKNAAPATIPRDIPEEQILFTANKYISNGTVPNISHVVYVDPEGYSQLSTKEELIAVGRAVSQLNKILPKRQFILMGPGRWGSRGDIKLGVSVTYSDINNTAMLIEIARKKGDYTPDLSFGTHFFQDLVESSIRYLPLYPDDRSVLFNERFFRDSRNILPDIAPEYAHLANVVYVIDVPANSDNQQLCVLMNGEHSEAVALLLSVATSIESAEDLELALEKPHEHHWRWRLRMAERIALQVDPVRFGVRGMYVLGSTKNATAGPSSDIDLLIHVVGSEEQKRCLQKWLEGWSLCLDELNYFRTGYKSDGLLDVHYITDEDIRSQTSFAAKINAVTDAARPLPMRSESGS